MYIIYYFLFKRYIFFCISFKNKQQWYGVNTRKNVNNQNYRFADNIDDPTGNFRGTPLTGWKVFLLLLCSLLGIVVCAVVGAVVFQKRQERNKRFY